MAVSGHDNLADPAPPAVTSPTVCYIQVETPAVKLRADAFALAESPRDDAQGATAAASAAADAVDGVRHFAWDSPLTDWDYRSRYDWLVWLLPCVAVPQIELRMGLIRSLWLASAAYLLAQLVAVAMAVCVAHSLLGRSAGDSDSRALSAFWLLALLLLLGLHVYALTRSLAVLRSRVRERLGVPGSYGGDLRAAFLRPASVVRQMGRQLHCDKLPLPLPSCCCRRRQGPPPADARLDLAMSGLV